MAHTEILKPEGNKNAWDWGTVDRDKTLTDEVEAGLTDHIIYYMAATAHEQDEYVEQVELSLENPPGGGKSVVVTVSNGVSTMTCTIEGDTDVFCKTTTNAFEWDVSAQDLTVKFTTTAGTTVGRLSIHIHKHQITIT